MLCGKYVSVWLKRKMWYEKCFAHLLPLLCVFHVCRMSHCVTLYATFISYVVENINKNSNFVFYDSRFFYLIHLQIVCCFFYRLNKLIILINKSIN